MLCEGYGWLEGWSVSSAASFQGQQVLDAVDGMVGEAGEHVAEVALRIEAVEFRGTDQTIEHGGALSALIRTGEEVILASQRDGTQSPFGGGMPTSGLCRALSPPIYSERELAALIVAEAA